MNSSDSILYRKNLKLLTSRYPGFSRDITRKFSPADSMEIIDSAGGLPTAKVDGVWVHSSRDPEKEAGKLVRSGLKSGSGICMIYGFGLAYHIEAIMALYPELEILIIEPDPPLFLKALEARDFTRLINSDKIGFLLDVEPAALSGVLGSFGASTIQTLKLRSLYDRHLDYYERVDKEVQNFISKKETNMNTLNRFGKAWVRNLFRNIELFAQAGDAGLWYDRFSEFPALVLAAGPSLDNVLPVLKTLSDRFILICVDTALRAVMASGVIPDFIVVVDPQYLNTRHLDNCLDSDLLKDKAILISESSTHPSIFRKSKLPVFFFKSVFPLGKLIERHAGIKSELGAGGSVSTTAWDFARRLGCRDIYIAGLDLGFPGGSTHCRNSLSPFVTSLRSARLSPPDTINFHSVKNADPFPVENNAGGQTLTDRRLIIYKWWFEEQIKRQKSEQNDFPLRFYNLSPEGVRIEGMELTELTMLNDAPRRRGEIDRIKMLVSGSPGKSDGDAMNLIKKTVTAIIAECSRLESICEDALAILNKLEEGHSGAELAEGFETLSVLDSRIASSPSKELTGFIIQPVLNDIIDNDNPVLENSRTLYENISSACSFHRRHALQAVTRLDADNRL